MLTVGLPPAFIPPVVVLPAASAVVPAVAGAAATGVALPVLPLVGAVVVGAAVAGLAALAVAAVVNGQLWGSLNQAAETPPGYEPTSPTVYTQGVARAPAGVPGRMFLTWTSPDLWPNSQSTAFVEEVVGLTIVRRYWEGKPWPGTTGQEVVAYGFNAQGVAVQGKSIYDGGSSGPVLFDGPVAPPIRLTALGTLFFPDEGTPFAVPIEPVSTATRAAPELEPLPEPAKAPPVVVPLPFAPPATPEPEPTREPIPTRPTRPVVAPPVTRPVPVTPAAVPRTTTPTTPAGGVQPTPQLPPTKTPTTVHVVNGSQIPANGPQATPQGIAQELGRIENKLARLLNPSPRGGPDLTDRLGLIWSAIQALAEVINSTGASGEYRLSSPCVVDDNGQRIERVVEFEGALTAFGVLQNRIDALATLLQEHKDLKQPICRETPATGGQAVTVNFVQID